MTLFIGIDAGTSGVRAVALSDEGVPVKETRVTLPPPTSQGAAVTQDPRLWAAAADEALESLLTHVPRRHVAAIAVDGTSGTVLGVRADGEAVTEGRLYNDATFTAEAAKIAALAPRESGAHGATSGLAKAMGLARRAGVARILHQADWLSGRLSGRFDRTDENNALKTGYDPVLRAWPAFIGALGLDMALLPRVLAAGAPAGLISLEAARRFGLPSTVVIAAGTTDGCASFIATGAARPGEAVTALGSTLTIKLLSEQPIFAPEHGVYSHRLDRAVLDRHAGGTVWLAGGASNAGGAALAQFFALDEMDALAARIDPDRSSGLNYYPLPRPGERFPVADPHLAPRLTPRPDDDAVFLQGLYEGIAQIEAHGYRLLAERGAPPISRVLSVGGGARNTIWRRIRARILGVPVECAPFEEAAVGAALLAKRGYEAWTASHPR